MVFESMYACIRLMRDLADYNEFVTFCKNYNENASSLFEGYKLLVKTIQRFFLYLFIHDFGDSIKLKKSFTLYRANFAGIQLNETSDNCEKMIALKNIIKYLKMCWNSKDFENLKNDIKKCDTVFEPFDKTYSRVVIPKTELPRITKEEIIKIYIRDIIWTFLSDTHRLIPYGYFVALLKNNCDSRESSIKGYKFALAFLISKNFGESNRASNEIIRLKNDWRSLDKSFSIIKKLVSSNKEEKSHVGFQSIFLNTEIFKKDFYNLLSQKLYAPSNLTTRQKLREKLFWYDIEVLTSDFFCGVGGLRFMLKGLIQEIIENDENGKIDIIRFIHPERKNQNTFSYALLIGVGGIISDGSGWIIFLDIGNDFSGQGSSNTMQIEEIISKNKRYINIKNFKIRFTEFKKNLDISDKGTIFLTVQNNKLKELINQYKQLSTELLILNYLFAQGFEIKKWSHTFDLGEIDFVCKKGKNIYIIEVTSQFNKNEEEIKDLTAEFTRKEIEIKKEFNTNNPIKKILFVTSIFKRPLHRLLKEAGIEIMEINSSFLMKLTTLKLNDNKLRSIQDLLQFIPEKDIWF